MKKLRTNITIALVFLSLIAFSQKTQTVKSDLPQGKSWKMVWFDEFNVTVPANTTATLHLPFSSKEPIELGSGSYTYEYQCENKF